MTYVLLVNTSSTRCVIQIQIFLTTLSLWHRRRVRLPVPSSRLCPPCQSYGHSWISRQAAWRWSCKVSPWCPTLGPQHRCRWGTGPKRRTQVQSLKTLSWLSLKFSTKRRIFFALLEKNKIHNELHLALNELLLWGQLAYLQTIMKL